MPTFLREASLKRQAVLDLLFRNLTRLAAFTVLALLAAIIGSLIVGSMPAIHAFGFGFLTSSEWNPVTDQYGAFIPIVGTLVTSGIALFIAIPVSFGIAIFLDRTVAATGCAARSASQSNCWRAFPASFTACGACSSSPRCSRDHVEPWINDHIGTMPFIGPFFSGPPMGIGILTAGIILAIMVIPFIASVMRDVFDVVPTMLKESAYGLGATTWEVMWNVVLPYTKIGVVGGIMLGLGRALGETMAVTFVIGNAHDLSKSLLMPGNSISSALANEFTEAVGELYTSSLIELGLILFFITFVVLSLARFMLYQLAKAKDRRPDMFDLYTRRRIINIVTLSISVFTMAFGLFWLGWILWTLLENGLPGLSLHVFTQTTPPPGSSGGLINAIFGSLMMTVVGVTDRHADRHPRRHLPGRIRPARLAGARHPLHQRRAAVRTVHRDRPVRV